LTFRSLLSQADFKAIQAHHQYNKLWTESKAPEYIGRNNSQPHQIASQHFEPVKLYSFKYK
jgi:4-alpha-glucanotransferase